MKFFAAMFRDALVCWLRWHVPLPVPTARPSTPPRPTHHVPPPPPPKRSGEWQPIIDRYQRIIVDLKRQVVEQTHRAQRAEQAECRARSMTQRAMLEADQWARTAVELDELLEACRQDARRALRSQWQLVPADEELPKKFHGQMVVFGLRSPHGGTVNLIAGGERPGLVGKALEEFFPVGMFAAVPTARE
jgi:hypothetical protein